ncbi:MAG: CheR family methyltransferase [Psychrobium sp.]
MVEDAEKTRASLSTDNDDIEYQLVLHAIRLKHGHNFDDYAQKSLKRRLEYHVEKHDFESLTDMIKPIVHDDAFFENLLNTVSVPVTEMFRDPQFFKTLREKVLPLLKTYPSVNIWHAGCATGEEVYSMAIMLEEEGLYDNCHIYATDFNANSLRIAQEGIYSYARMQKYTENYYLAGGKRSFSEYYDSHEDGIKMDEALSRNVTFAKHNLASDSVFGQFNLILCRNVLIYFGKPLQEKVFSLFSESILPLGYLCLGSHESLDYSRALTRYETVFDKHKVYRKKQ